MYIHNRILSLLYKLVIVLVAGYGLFLYSGLPAQFNWGMFKYYTILSNALCFIFFILSIVRVVAQIFKTGIKGPATLAPHFKGVVTNAIIVTLLIYQFVLASSPFSMDVGGGNLGNQIVHLFVPLLVIVDWLLFDKKGFYTFGDPFLGCILPFLYFVCTVFAAEMGTRYLNGSRYPYEFINFDALGVPKVMLNVSILLLVFLAVNFVIYFIDKLLGKIGKK